MNKIVVLSIAALSLGGLRAQDATATATPAPDAAPKPLPPIEQSAGPGDRGPHGPRPWMKDHPGKPDGDRREMMKKRMQMMRDHKGFGGGPGAQGGPGGPDRPKFGEGQILAQELNLTDDQKVKAKAIMEATKPKIQAIQEEGRGKVKAVMEDAMKELRPILTPEQQAVLDDLQKLRADKAALGPVQKSDKPGKAKKPEKKKGQ